jgi:hypothetical protein
VVQAAELSHQAICRIPRSECVPASLQGIVDSVLVEVLVNDLYGPGCKLFLHLEDLGLKVSDLSLALAQKDALFI